MEDEELLKWYNSGWNNELDGTFGQVLFFNSELERQAYFLGGLHAIVGDDVKSIDALTDKEILQEIKERFDYKNQKFINFCKLIVENTKSF